MRTLITIILIFSLGLLKAQTPPVDPLKQDTIRCKIQVTNSRGQDTYIIGWAVVKPFVYDSNNPPSSYPRPPFLDFLKGYGYHTQSVLLGDKKTPIPIGGFKAVYAYMQGERMIKK